jgi:hypothetical protein
VRRSLARSERFMSADRSTVLARLRRAAIRLYPAACVAAYLLALVIVEGMRK